MSKSAFALVYVGTYYDVTIRKVKPDGTDLWGITVSANTVRANNANHANVCPDGAGGCVVAWIDTAVNAHGRIRAQRLDAAGNLLWGTTGVEITSSSLDSYDKARAWVVQDSNGDFIVGWLDTRNTANYQPFVQKCQASDGATQWTGNGVLVDSNTTNAKAMLRLVAGGSGAVNVLYARGTNLYVMQIDGGGGAAWGGPVQSIAGVTFPWGDCCTDGAGGVFVLAEGSLVKLQRIDSTGTTYTVVTLSNASLAARYYGINPDGSGGAVAWWHEVSAGSPHTCNVRVQRVNSSSAIQWASGGVSVVTGASSTANATRPYQVASDGAGGSICGVEYPVGASTYETHVFKVDSSGNVSWDTTLINPASNGASCPCCPDGGGGAFALYYTPAGPGSVRVRRLSSAGALQWSDGTEVGGTFEGLNQPIVLGTDASAEISSPVTDIEFTRGVAGNRNIRVDNQGEENLVVTAMACSDSHVSVTTTLPITITPGSHATVVAHYDGSGLADASSTITTTSNTETNPELDIAVAI